MVKDMKNYFKFILLILCIFTFAACGNKEVKNVNNNKIDDIEYPIYSIEEYNEMDLYTYEKTLNNIKYKITYFFKDDMCVNAKEDLIFNSNELAKDYYNEILNKEEYNNIEVINNHVIYYNNPEYFEYMMYPKDMLIELINKKDYLDMEL